MKPSCHPQAYLAKLKAAALREERRINGPSVRVPIAHLRAYDCRLGVVESDNHPPRRNVYHLADPSRIIYTIPKGLRTVPLSHLLAAIKLRAAGLARDEVQSGIRHLLGIHEVGGSQGNALFGEPLSLP